MSANPKKRPLAPPPVLSADVDPFDPFSMGLPPPPSAAPPPPPRPAVGPGGRAPKGGLKPLTAEFRDQNCHCRDCGRLFVFTAEQQQQLAAKGFATVAKSRCAACAKHKKNRFGTRAAAAEPEAKLGSGFKYQVKGNSQAAMSIEDEDEEGQNIRPAPRSNDNDTDDEFDVYDCGDAPDERGSGDRRGGPKKGAAGKGKKAGGGKYKGGYSL
tara:strand:- start:206 stop:841 length:636 start_codon:yes stop_codon:yes gene_type:complete